MVWYSREEKNRSHRVIFTLRRVQEEVVVVEGHSTPDVLGYRHTDVRLKGWPLVQQCWPSVREYSVERRLQDKKYDCLVDAFWRT
jgi:hypothetical protein